jgi:uncharacterized MnhB-related membrane protein
MGKLHIHSRTGIQPAKEKSMDLMVTAVVGIIFAIIAVLIAIITRKKLKRVLIYGVLGLIIGLPVGYVLAPEIISFF